MTLTDKLTLLFCHGSIDEMSPEEITAAVLSEIENAGYVVVPKEPTEAMLEAGFVHTGDPCWLEDVAKAYRAMVSAPQTKTDWRVA